LRRNYDGGFAAQHRKNFLEGSLNTLQAVSVVVVNHNAGELLVECVRSALAQAEQVVVVDNDSSDSSRDLLEGQFAKEARLLVLCAGKNMGFSAGSNLGFGLATQAHVLFLNPDCLLGAGSVQRMLAVLESDAQIGMVGGLLMNPDGTEQGGARRAVPTPWRSFVRAFGLYRLSGRWPRIFLDFHLHKQPLPEKPIEVEAISGALMLVRRLAIEDVGLWDEAYFLHCEDLDWCMRFRQRGWKICFVPDAPVIHHRGLSSRSKPIFVEWHKHKGMMRFYRKFFRNQYPGVLMWLVGLGVWLRFVLIAGFYLARRLLRKPGKRA
jgi:GT2 family glycosyltransferase